MKIKFKAGNDWLASWYLIPTIRFGLHSDWAGGFVAFTFLRFDACLTWRKS